MKTKVSSGSPLDFTVPSGGCTSGVALLIGSCLIIPTTTNLVGDTASGHTEGVFDHASDTGAAWSMGDLLYWDNTNKVFTKTSSGNTKAGYAAAAKLSATATGRIRLVPTI